MNCTHTVHVRVHVLYTYCTCTVHILYTYCICIVHVLYMYCTRTVHVCTLFTTQSSPSIGALYVACIVQLVQQAGLLYNCNNGPLTYMYLYILHWVLLLLYIGDSLPIYRVVRNICNSILSYINFWLVVQYNLSLSYAYESILIGRSREHIFLVYIACTWLLGKSIFKVLLYSLTIDICTVVQL